MTFRLGGILATSLATTLSACGAPVEPEAPEAAADIKADFDGLSLIYGPYQDLLGKKVPPTAFDQGCHLIEGSGAEQKEWVVGRGDGHASICEAIEGVLSRYRQFPDHADVVAGTRLFLSLEATGELESFARSVRERVDRVHARLTAEISDVGVKPGSFEYELRRALGLFLFAVGPQEPSTLKAKQDQYWPLLQELENLGMNGFVAYLMEHEGGLGISEMVWQPLDPAMTAPLQALREQRGTVLHKVSLLYAVFTYVGMKGKFAMAPLKSILPYLRKQKIAIVYSSRDAVYFYMVVDVGDGHRRYLDPNLIQSLEYEQTTRLPLRYYTAYRAIEYGNYAVLTKDFRSALMFFEQAQWLVPELADAYFNIGNTYLLTQQFAKAVAAYNKTLEYDPGHSSALSNLAVIRYMNGEVVEAERLVLRAIDSDPENFNAVRNYITFLIERGRYDDAIRFLEKVLKTYPLVYPYRELLEQLKQYQNANP